MKGVLDPLQAANVSSGGPIMWSTGKAWLRSWRAHTTAFSTCSCRRSQAGIEAAGELFLWGNRKALLHSVQCDPDFRHNVSGNSWAREVQASVSGRGGDGGAEAPRKHVGSVERNLAEGRRLHTGIRGAGLDGDRELGGAVVGMLVKCGSGSGSGSSSGSGRGSGSGAYRISEADWTGLISGYAKQGQNHDAVDAFEKMQEAGVMPTSFTYCAVLKACAGLKDLSLGKYLHRDVVRNGLEADPFVAPALVTMYAKIGSLVDALEVFNASPKEGNVYLWNTMIAGYQQHGYGTEALQLFGRMQEQGVVPNRHSYVHVLRACTSIGAVSEGRKVHEGITSTGLNFDPIVGAALVEMYSQAGQMADAKKVFDELPSRTVNAWNTMIRAFGQNDDPMKALECFYDLQKQGLRPDEQTFIALFVTCSHQGLVKEGRNFFRVMTEEYGMAPTLQHFTCMADLLGRAGHLKEAEHMLKTMPFVPTIVGWTSLLSACSRFGELDIGRRCFDNVVRMDPSNASGYLLMSRLYTAVGMKEEAYRIDRLRRSAGAKNYPASVLIHVNDGVHEFLSGEGSKNHPLFRQLQEKVISVTENMKRLGFDVGDSPAYSRQPPPDPSFSYSPSSPSSPLSEADHKAVADYNRAMGPIVGRKKTNRLRMCASCHQWVKVLSLTEKREVIMRDGYRTHHFKDGVCSCKDHDYGTFHQGTVLEMTHDSCALNKNVSSYRYSIQPPQ